VIIAISISGKSQIYSV